MNLASIKLCRELYALSGWDDTSHVHDLSNYQIKGEPGDIGDDWCPAYELGYLLRKMPKHIVVAGVEYELIMRSLTDADIRFHYWSDSKRHRALSTSIETGLIGGFGDTPEDAACKLAIKLFKQGILKKEAL